MRFRIADIGTTSIFGSQSLEAAMVPVRRNAEISTGAAILNPEEHEIRIILSLRDTSGEQVENGFATFDLAPGSRVSLFLEELFPNAVMQDFVGELVIRSEEGSFAAMALEVGYEPGQFTALPVTRLKQE